MSLNLTNKIDHCTPFALKKKNNNVINIDVSLCNKVMVFK